MDGMARDGGDWNGSLGVSGRGPVWHDMESRGSLGFAVFVPGLVDLVEPDFSEEALAVVPGEVVAVPNLVAAEPEEPGVFMLLRAILCQALFDGLALGGLSSSHARVTLLAGRV